MGIIKENARTILEENPWTTGVWSYHIDEKGYPYPASPEDPDANCFCIVGAIERSMWEMGFHNDKKPKEKERQLTAIATAIIENCDDEVTENFMKDRLGDDYEERNTEELIERLKKGEVHYTKDELLWFVSDWNDDQTRQEDIMRVLEKAFPKRGNKLDA